MKKDYKQKISISFWKFSTYKNNIGFNTTINLDEDGFNTSLYYISYTMEFFLQLADELLFPTKEINRNS